MHHAIIHHSVDPYHVAVACGGLDESIKASILKNQYYLYKGINAGLLAQINEALYIRSINGAKNNIRIHPNCELIEATPNHSDEIVLHPQHRVKNIIRPFH